MSEEQAETSPVEAVEELEGGVMEDLFGEDVSDDEGEDQDDKVVEVDEEKEAAVVENTGGISKSIDDLLKEQIDAETEKQAEAQAQVQEAVEPLRQTIASIPDLAADQLYFIQNRGVLAFEMKPFQPNDASTFRDTEGKAMATVRWRQIVSEEGEGDAESNARLAKWADGSWTLHVGNEFFDVSESEMSGKNYLFVRLPDGVLQQASGEANKMLFRPDPRKAALRMKEHKAQGHLQGQGQGRTSTGAVPKKKAEIRIIRATIDPEYQKTRLEKAEEEKIKARETLEKKRRDAQVDVGRLTENFLEEGQDVPMIDGDEDDGMDGEGREEDFHGDIDAIKEHYGMRKKRKVLPGSAPVPIAAARKRTRVLEDDDE